MSLFDYNEQLSEADANSWNYIYIYIYIKQPRYDTVYAWIY